MSEIKIKITIAGNEVELSVDEAKDVYIQLQKLFIHTVSISSVWADSPAPKGTLTVSGGLPLDAQGIVVEGLKAPKLGKAVIKAFDNTFKAARNKDRV
jgi:hypothetical protein